MALFHSFFKAEWYSISSLVAQMVKNLPAMQETRAWSLGREDPLEEEITTLSSILAWEIPWVEEPGRATVHGITKNRTQLKWLSTRTYHIFFLHSSIDGYLSSFHFLAIENSAAVITGAHVSFQIMIFSVDYFLFCLCSALLCKNL